MQRLYAIVCDTNDIIFVGSKEEVFSHEHDVTGVFDTVPVPEGWEDLARNLVAKMDRWRYRKGYRACHCAETTEERILLEEILQLAREND